PRVEPGPARRSGVHDPVRGGALRGGRHGADPSGAGAAPAGARCRADRQGDAEAEGGVGRFLWGATGGVARLSGVFWVDQGAVVPWNGPSTQRVSTELSISIVAGVQGPIDLAQLVTRNEPWRQADDRGVPSAPAGAATLADVSRPR